MSKNFIYKVLSVLVIVCAALFWLLSILLPDAFGAFNLAWAGVLLCGGLGVILLVQGCLQRQDVIYKSLRIWIAVGLIVCAFLCLVSALTLGSNIILPIIAIVIAVGLLISTVFTGGKKWDEGDNQKVGYKTYAQRKKSEEKKEEKENNDK